MAIGRGCWWAWFGFRRALTPGAWQEFDWQGFSLGDWTKENCRWMGWQDHAHVHAHAHAYPLSVWKPESQPLRAPWGSLSGSLRPETLCFRLRAFISGSYDVYGIALHAKNSKKCLDIPGQSTSPETSVRTWDCNSAPSQVFDLIYTGKRTYRVR